MSDLSEVNQFLSGGGAPAFKFSEVGDTCEGVILSAEVRDVTDFVSGEVKTYSDGNPMKQVVLTVQTDERDKEIENDDGVRRIFAKGQMRTAVSEALRQANAKLEVGGTIQVTYSGDKPSEKKGFHPAKQFTAAYVPPSAQALADAFDGEEFEDGEEPF